jgi:hypothetical protein
LISPAQRYPRRKRRSINHRDNAGGDPASHTDDAVNAYAAAGDGAGEQGHGRAGLHGIKRGGEQQPRAILLSHATPSVFHQRHLGRVLRSS